MERLSLSTRKRSEFIDITSQVQQEVSRSKIKNGMCIVFVPHTTAGITINENADPSVRLDIINHLEKMVPARGNYQHSEGNSDAHIKASLMGSSLNMPIENNKLVLGTWQGIYFAEFDGPRSRTYLIEVVSNA